MPCCKKKGNPQELGYAPFQQTRRRRRKKTGEGGKKIKIKRVWQGHWQAGQRRGLDERRGGYKQFDDASFVNKREGGEEKMVRGIFIGPERWGGQGNDKGKKQKK